MLKILLSSMLLYGAAFATTSQNVKKFENSFMIGSLKKCSENSKDSKVFFSVIDSADRISSKIEKEDSEEYFVKNFKDGFEKEYTVCEEDNGHIVIKVKETIYETVIDNEDEE